MRVLTHNIHKGLSAWNRRFTLHALREEIRMVQADVVLLQEVQGVHEGRRARYQQWPDEAQFEFLADQVWHHHAYARNAVYPDGHHGNAILSRYPILRWDNLDVSEMARASRSVLHAVIDVDGAPETHVLCIHFGLGEGERVRQTRALAERIREQIPPDAALIIGGDFNDWRGNCGKLLERTVGVEEAHRSLHGSHARTFPAWLPMLRVDRIYSRGAIARHCERGTPDRWRGMSDHLPLVCDLSLPVEGD